MPLMQQQQFVADDDVAGWVDYWLLWMCFVPQGGFVELLILFRKMLSKQANWMIRIRPMIVNDPRGWMTIQPMKPCCG